MSANSMQPGQDDPGFRPDINALRALAVVAVIAFHFGLPGAASGYIGVDIFFVISGFLIGGQVMSRCDRGSFSLKHFFAGRIRRIVPALAVTCALVLAWGWFYQLPADYKVLARSATNSVQFLSNRYFARQIGYFDLGAAYKPLLHTWSLAVEAQFYVFLPFVLMGLWKLPARWRMPLLGALAVLSFGGALKWAAEEPTRVFFSFGARAWEFLVGCLAARMGSAPGLRLGRARAPLLGLAWLLLLASCLLLPPGITWPGPWTLVPAILTAAAIVLGTGQAAGTVVRLPVIQHLGTISYSLYLWHWPLLVAWRLTFLEDPSRGWGVVPLVAGTWAAGWLSWRFAEQPLRTRPAWGAPARLYKFYVALVLVAMSFAAWMSRTDGLEARMPPYVRAAAVAAEFDGKLVRCWRLPGANPREPEHSCELGNPRAVAPTLAVWGDSHALQYLDALREVVDPSGKAGQLFHFPGCEPSLQPTQAGAGCDAHNREVLRYLNEHPSIRTVLVAIRQNDPVRVQRAWQAADALAAQGRRVVVLGPTPEGHRAVAQEWAAVQLLHRRPMREMTVARAEPTTVASFDQRQQHWQELGRAVVARHGDRVRMVDLAPLFCDAQRCWLVRDGVGLVRDVDHLTPAAARRVIAQVFPVIAPMDQ